MARLVPILGSDRAFRTGDVVFVHGLDGDAIQTWHRKGCAEQFWPRWLGEDLPTTAIWSLDYEAASMAWRGAAMPLSDRATNTLANLEACDLGNRPIFFVTHSLGGLLVKQVLRQALDYGQPQWSRIAQSVRGIVFLSTPHSGANIASWLEYASLVLRNNVTLEDLRAHDPHLRDLNLWFRNNVGKLNVECQVYFEKQTIGKLLVVDEVSADPGIQGVIPVPLDANHIEICKPKSRDTILYRRTVKFIQSCLAPSVSHTNPQALEERDKSADRRAAVPDAADTRIVTVFLSSPGDVGDEIALIDDVVRDVDACMQPLGVTIRTWRYARNAPPGVGVDAQAVLHPYIGEYDVYIGVMRHRLGTPTQRAASGTVEEFQNAKRRWERTGRPAIFFYFSSDPSDGGDPQSAAVQSFRAAYPGLFREFQNAPHLASTVKQDLLLWLAREVLGRLRAKPPLTVPPWLEAVIAKETPPGSPTLRSLRTIQRIKDAFPIAAVFEPVEQEALWAAVFLSNSAPESAALEHSLSSMANRIVVESGWPTSEPAGSFHDERNGALAAILAMALLLEQDRSGIDRPGHIPPADADFEDWIRFLTREIRVHPGGFAQFVLEIPGIEYLDALKCSTSLRLEALWQRMRGRLAPLGIGLTVVPSEIVISPPGRLVPKFVLDRLAQSCLPATAVPLSLGHLGGTETPPLGIDALLPLPGSTVAGTLKFLLETPRRHMLEIHRDSGSIQRLECSGADSISLDTARLLPDTTYDWSLCVVDAAGFNKKIRAGTFRVAGTTTAEIRKSVQSTLPEQHEIFCRAFGMHDDVMRALWDRLGCLDTAAEDRLWAYERLLYAFEFSLERYPQLIQVDAYRSAAGWVLSLLRKGERQ